MKDITQPMLTEYETGGHYNLHIDSVEINNLRTDHSMTLFLNEPSEYEGGELVLSLSDTVQKIKEPAGMLVIYPTGLLHEVTEVTSGHRRVAIMWSQSLIDDYLLRSQVIDLGRAIGNVTHWCNKNNVDAKTTQNLLVPLEQVRNNFVREYGSFD
jgi:PKHD-type hydroxylase